MSIRVLLFFIDCQSVQNVSIGIFISVFITESPSAVCKLATRQCMWCRENVIGKMIGDERQKVIIQNGKMCM